MSVSAAHKLHSMIREAFCLSQAIRNLHCNPLMGPCFAACLNSPAIMLRSCSGALTGRGCTLVGCQPFNAQPITYTSSTPAWQICQHASAECFNTCIDAKWGAKDNRSGCQSMLHPTDKSVLQACECGIHRVCWQACCGLTLISLMR
jgi:hypothetical protein